MVSGTVILFFMEVIIIRYNNYHKHTHYSNIGGTADSIIKVEDIAKRAIELGHTTLSTIEHGYAGNIFEYYDIAQKYGLKFIFGVEFYYVDNRFEKDRSNTHMVILAKNDQGKREITKIMSEANVSGYYYKPRIDKELLLSLTPKNVMVTTACLGSYIGKHQEYENNYIIPLLSHFKDNFYLEIQDNVHPKQIEYNKKLLQLHNKYNIPLIHGADSHYIYPEQDKDRTEFLNGKNIYYADEDGFTMDYPDSDIIFQRYDEQGVFTREQVEQSLKNTWVIDEFEDIIMTKEIKMPSIYPNLNINEKHKKLRDILNKEWQKEKQELPIESHQRHIDAVNFELDIIEGTGEVRTVDYFLLNYEIIKRAIQKGGVLTRTGRGSAPSYYINKLLGFTEIDRVDAPIPLYPTRFMSKSRILETKSLPDIDFNTADPKHFEEAAKEMMGEDNVYIMIAYGTMQDSEAFRNLCRARGIQQDEFNEVGKDLDSYRNHPQWADIIEESKKFIGVIDSASPSPCAYLLLDQPISEEVGLYRLKSETTKKETIVTLIDSNTSDVWKYLKNDFLTVTVWQIIADTYRMLNKPIPNIRELTNLLDDQVWDLYEKGLVTTLNQAGTDSAKPQVMQYSPKSVAELSAWVAAIRPNFQSMKHIFLNREEFSYGIPEFDKILKPSHNFILYQENIMATLMFAGFPEDITYGLLKAISKKKPGIIEPIQEKFLQGFIEKTNSEENAHKVWKIVEDSVNYGFNSSHSLSVALDSLYGAELKAHYPLEYYAVVLNIYENDTTTTGKIYSELQHFNIQVEPIKFRKTLGHYSPNKENNTIVKGTKSIKNLNSKVAEELYTLKDNQYDNFMDILLDISNNTSANKTHMETLIKLNFFDEFGGNKLLLQLYEEFRDGKLKYKKDHKDKTILERIEKRREFEQNLRQTLTEKEQILSVHEQVLFEKDALGYVQSTYPQLEDSFVSVLEIDTKYSPRITVVQLNNGMEYMYKMPKKDYYHNGKAVFDKGDILKITLENRNKNRLVDGKWIPTEETEQWIKSCTVYKNKQN